MKLSFDSMDVENFGCLKTQTITLSGLGVGVHFVRGVNKYKPALGSNGVGKSSMWNALSWCLTGVTLSGLKSTEVRPWSSLKAVTTVAVSVSIDSSAHVIKRATTSNGLWIDDKVVAQEEIYRLIGLTALTLRHTLLLGQGQELFFDLKPTGKMEILSECLDLDKWDSRSKYSRDKARSIETEISVSAGAATSLEEQLLRRRHDMRDFKTKSAEWEDQNATKSLWRDTQLIALEKLLNTQSNELGTADLAYDGAEAELRQIRKDLMKLASTFNERVADVSALQAQVASLTEQLEALHETAKSGVCSACGQEIANQKRHAKHAAVQIADAEKYLAKAQTLFDKALAAKIAMGATITAKRKEEDGFNDKSNEAIDARTRAQTKVSQTKAEIAALKKQTDDEQENPYAVMMQKARKDIVEFKHRLVVLDDDMGKLNRRLVRTKYWVEGFKNVRLYLIEEVLDELQGVTQGMLPMVGLDGWDVAFDIEKETKSGNVTNGLNVSITMDDGRPINWKAWSGGEGQRLRILGAMALSEVLLRRAGVECDQLVLDEPTKHLSPEGVMMTVDFLCDRARDMQIFYVDHTARASNRFASTITVTRSPKGLSTITTQ